MRIEEIINQFNTTPFIFWGSGMTRRYLDLPSWRELLEHFAKEVDDNPFSYASYENRAGAMNPTNGIMPKTAELIEKDYNSKWFADVSIRHVNKQNEDLIKSGLSPFKAEVADYIKNKAKVNNKYDVEISELAKLTSKNITGVITTNYDTFIEDHFAGYKSYVGQNELIFSAIQGIGEVYKIHGSVLNPESIVINEKDYEVFRSKNTYLASKLMTIFMEYPIIFMGYSISDPNIQEIIESMAVILDSKQLKMLENRFVFVEYDSTMKSADITPYTIMINGNPLNMTRIRLNDYTNLYKAMSCKYAALPVRILRRFKEELYAFTLTNNPTSKLKIAGIDDTRVDDEELVIAIGTPDAVSTKGLSGINGNEWYRDIVMDDLNFSADDKIEFGYGRLINQNSSKLPIFKHLKNATKEFEEYRERLSSMDYEQLISNTNRKTRAKLKYNNVNAIWKSNYPRKRKLREIGCLAEADIDIYDLEKLLKELFNEDYNVLEKAENNERTSIKLLIRIYDYMKWGKQKSF